MSRPHRASGRNGRRFVLALIGLLFAATSSVVAQESDTDESAAAEVIDSPIAVALPSRDSVGRPIWPIGIYQSQLVDVVPEDFRAITISQLRQALQAGNEGRTDPRRWRAVSGFYDVHLEGNLLSSDHSEVVVATQGSETAHIPLGEVNLAIVPAQTDQSLADPSQTVGTTYDDLYRLEANEYGDLMAVIPGREEDANEAESPDDSGGPPSSAGGADETSPLFQSRIGFAWTLRGQTVRGDQRFDLRIPRTPQTRMVISTSRDVVLESNHGVLIRLPNPPPYAQTEGRPDDVAWYLLEAGGLHQIELIAKPVSVDEEQSKILVRRETRQYQIESAGVSWTHRLTLEIPELRESIRLECPQGTIVDARMNSVEANPELTRRADGSTSIGLSLIDSLSARNVRASAGGFPSEILSPTAGVDLVTITISGNSDFDPESGWCDLPSVYLSGAEVRWSEPSTQAVVTLSDRLSIAQWELPEHWTQTVESASDSDEILFAAAGPPVRRIAKDSAWSRIQLVESPQISFEHVWLSLKASESPTSSLRGTARMRCRQLDQLQSPIRMEFEDGWTIDSISIVGSQRQVPVPTQSSIVTIWPTRSDLQESIIEVDVVGHRRIDWENTDSASRSAWMVRPFAQVNERLTLLQPPRRRRWDGNSILTAGKVPRDSLSQEANDYFKPNADSLILNRPYHGEFALALEPNKSAIRVSLSVEVSLKGEQLQETVVVTPNSLGDRSVLPIVVGRLEEIDSDGEATPVLAGEFRWMLRRIDGSANETLGDVQRQFDNENGWQTYELHLDDRPIDGFEIVGTRLSPARPSVRLMLPSVIGATYRSAETVVADRLQMSGVPDAVQRIPHDPDGTADTKGIQTSTFLRYDPVARPSIVIEHLDSEESNCLIWNQVMQVTASSRGEDAFRLTAEVSGRDEIRLAVDPTLELVAAIRNGVRLTLDPIRDGLLSMEPENAIDLIDVRFRRRHSSRSWIRTCQLPKIQIVGRVVREDVRVFTSDQSILVGNRSAFSFLDSLLGAEAAPDDESSQLAWLILHRNVGIGIGWLVALVTFGCSWSFARSFQLGIPALLVVLAVCACATVIWWPYQLEILGWVALPIALGGLLHAVNARNQQVAEVYEEQVVRGGKESHATRGSQDFSFSKPLGLLLFGLTIASMDLAPATAQNGDRRGAEALPASRSTAPINLLIPVGPDHKVVGDKLYIAEEDYLSITTASDPARVEAARFETANYRAVLGHARDSNNEITVDIEADYTIRLPRVASNIRLPISAETIRRVELLDANGSRIIRHSIDRQGMVSVTLPPDDRFQLRITFVPRTTRISELQRSATAETSDLSSTTGTNDAVERENDGDADRSSQAADATLVELAIPKIHSARVSVESPRTILIDAFGKTQGMISRRPESGRYSASLGPISKLEFLCRATPQNTARQQTQIKSRFRLSAGIETTVVECEVDWNQRSGKGDTVELLVVGARPDAITSPSWRLLDVVTPDTNDPRLDVGPDEAPTPTGDSDTPRGADPNDNTIANFVCRFEKQDSSNSPIRLLWQLPSQLNDPTSTSDSKVMQIPRVIASSANQSPELSIAVESHPEIRFSELNVESTPLPVEEFLDAWKGFRGNIDRAFFCSDGFPRIALWKNKLPTSTISVNHHLHIAPARLELRMDAELVMPDPSVSRSILRCPPGFRWVSCNVNGVPVETWRYLSKSQSRGIELALDDQRIDGQMNIQAVAEADKGRSGNFPIPRFLLNVVGAYDESYRVTRSRSVRAQVEPQSEPAADSLEETNVWTLPELSDNDLALAQSPVAMTSIQYTLSPSESPDVATPWDSTIRFSARNVEASFTPSQFSVLRYQDGNWICDSKFVLTRRDYPEFIDVQIPASWANAIQVSGAVKWTQTFSSDGSTSLLRVAPSFDETSSNEASELRQLDLEIRGTLDAKNQARVSVPDVVLLTGKTRNRLFAVPNQLTTDTIQWSRSAVSQRRPELVPWSSFVNPIDRPQGFSVLGPDSAQWSIELEPVNQGSVDPVALASDARVLLDHDRLLVFQRFDVIPETIDSVDIRLPRNATLLGNWSAGTEIRPSDQAISQPVGADGESSGRLLNVPLTFSHLSQTVEVLFALPISRNPQEDYLAEMVGVDVEQSWVAYYGNGDESEPLRTRLISPKQESSVERFEPLALGIELAVYDDWRRSLALSAIKSVERSRDTFAERSEGEIRSWMLPWIARYQSLTNHYLVRMQPSVLRPNQPDESGLVEAAALDSSSQPKRESSNDVSWSDLELRFQEMTSGMDLGTTAVNPEYFSERRWSDYELLAIRSLDAGEEKLLVASGFGNSAFLRQCLLDSLKLLMSAIGVLLLLPILRRLRIHSSHPAVWLFVVGCISLFIVPLPIGGTLIVLSVLIPIVNRPKVLKLHSDQSHRSSRLKAH